MTIHIPTMTGGGIEVTTENLAKTRFVLSDGTVEEYDIVGPLDEQTMMNYEFYQRRENPHNEQNEQEFWTEITEKRIVEAYIGNTVTSIDCMWDQTNLTTIVIPSSVTEISGFSNCTSLTNITIPNSVTDIGDCAFQECSGLTSMTMPNSVTNIGSNAFYGCSNLTSIVISDNTVTIGNSAFSGCTGLTSVTIPDGATSIGEGAFYGCNGLTSMTIPASVTRIGYNTFHGCDNLKDVTMTNRTKAELDTMDPTWNYWGLGFHSNEEDTFAFTIHCQDQNITWEP